MQLKVKRLTETAVLPVKAHQSDAGFDICADEDITINVGETVTVSTGLSVAIPEWLDRPWYIEMATKRINDYLGS